MAEPLLQVDRLTVAFETAREKVVAVEQAVVLAQRFVAGGLGALDLI